MRSLFQRSRKLDRVRNICSLHGGGIYKLIDENRELYQLLQDPCPDFLRESPWVDGWLKAQDDFLQDIESVFRGEMSQPRFGPDIVRRAPWANFKDRCWTFCRMF
jgi:hypothetical protein